MMHGLFSKQRIVAPPEYNRWRVPVASIAIHMCIGSVYAWSIFNPALTKIRGVVAPSGDDWTLSQVVWIFTVAIVFLGLAAAVAGKWLEEVGPRKVGVLAACCWGGGYVIGSVGIYTHQLWLIYCGYGVIGGCGLGLGYVSPVSTLIRWFPDRRGMASGLAIMGFGGGAIIGAPIKAKLLETFYRQPDFLGSVSQVNLVTSNGRRFADVHGEKVEVVIGSAQGVNDITTAGLEGVYVVNSGATGAAETFAVLGLVYAAVMLVAAFSYRVPATDWKPPKPVAALRKKNKEMISSADVLMTDAVRTPQFYQLWLMLCLNVTAGIGVLGVAKTMITEIFGSSLPNLVDASFAATYVVMIGVFNMTGRFIWASASDLIGRKTTYWCFFLIGILLYLSIPITAHQMTVNPSITFLIYFYAATMIIFTMYGGAFATIPAYLADVFGTRHVGAIHGRLLTAWATAGVLGPLAITSLRQSSVSEAIRKLASSVDPTKFESKFGAPVSQLELLVDQKTVTISNLLEIAPLNTVDPTSTIYNSTMYLMASLLMIALVSNALMKPVNPKYHSK